MLYPESDFAAPHATAWLNDVFRCSLMNSCNIDGLFSRSFTRGAATTTRVIVYFKVAHSCALTICTLGVPMDNASTGFYWQKLRVEGLLQVLTCRRLLFVGVLELLSFSVSYMRCVQHRIQIQTGVVTILQGDLFYQPYWEFFQENHVLLEMYSMHLRGRDKDEVKTIRLPDTLFAMYHFVVLHQTTT